MIEIIILLQLLGGLVLLGFLYLTRRRDDPEK